MHRKPCEFCTDGNPDEDEAKCVFPYYGLAPHKHTTTTEGEVVIGMTTITPKTEWPANFNEDQDCEGLGVYTHCLKCGLPNTVTLCPNCKAPMCESTCGVKACCECGRMTEPNTIPDEVCDDLFEVVAVIHHQECGGES